MKKKKNTLDKMLSVYVCIWEDIILLRKDTLCTFWNKEFQRHMSHANKVNKNIINFKVEKQAGTR